MGRDKTGKKEESAQLATNQAQQAKDVAGRDKTLTGYDSSVNKLEANPGYDPSYLAAARTRSAGLIGGAFEDSADQLERNAASTGHAADDAGLYPQEQELAREKARMATGADQDYIMADAQQRLDTRRAIPGMKLAPAGIYQGSASNLAGVNAGMINGRMTADNAPTFWQSAALAGIQGAGAAASGGLSAGGAWGCWVAEALFGKDDARTHLLRYWMHRYFAKHWAGKYFVLAYLRFGRSTASWVERSGMVRLMLTPLFLLLLSMAEAEVTGAALSLRKFPPAFCV